MNIETGNITKTMNVSHNNATKDNTEDVHIAGSRALCVFINTVSMLWVCVFSWLTYVLFRKTDMRISPDKTETVKFRDLEKYKRAKTIMRVWSFINFAILWLNMLVLIYCHSGSRNCILYYESDSKMTNARAMLIICAVCTYSIQLFENISDRLSRRSSRHVMITTLHEDLLQLIYWQKPVIRWKATCYHNFGEGDTEETHNEVISCSTKI